MKNGLEKPTMNEIVQVKVVEIGEKGKISEKAKAVVSGMGKYFYESLFIHIKSTLHYYASLAD